MGSSFKFDDEEILNRLSFFEKQFNQKLDEFANNCCIKLEAEAKDNAKWKDRTSDARNYLKSFPIKQPDHINLFLRHGVKYGVFLELAHEKKFAIIMPTIEYVGAFEIMPAFHDFLSNLD